MGIISSWKNYFWICTWIKFSISNLLYEKNFKVPVYVNEFAPKELIGELGSIMTMSGSLGLFISFLIGFGYFNFFSYLVILKLQR